MNNNALRRRVVAVPMALPLVAVVGSIVGSWGWCLSVLAVAAALAARCRRVAVMALLCALVCGMHTELRQRAGVRLQVAGQVTGTVTRVYAHAVQLQPAGICPAVYLRGVEGAAVGDVLRVSTAPEAPLEQPPVRGMFDAAAWRRGQGIGAGFRAAAVQHLGHPLSWAALRGAGLDMRARLAARLMPPGRDGDARRQVLCAMVLGAREQAAEDTLGLFRRGGCLHAFAVSGLHVGVILLFGHMLCRLLHVRPVVARPLLLLLVGAYVWMTGCAVSALRAYVMFAAVVLGVSLRRRLSAANIWCAAACFFLLLQPWLLYDTGFRLSFAVYAAICAGVRFCLRTDSPWFGPDAYIPFRILTPWELRVKGAETALRGVVLVSLCAWFVSLPLIAHDFHTVTPWSFLTNIALALPLMAAMGAGMLLLLCSGIPYLGGLAAAAADGAAGVLLAVVGFFAGLPGAYLPAALPAPADGIAIVPLGYGESACVLGNPGLLVACGHENEARFTAVPALFHGGWQPAAMLHTPRRSGGETVARAAWPKLRMIDGSRPAVCTTAAGRYTIYPAPPELPSTPAENRLPVVLWEQGNKKRVLWVGDASAATVATIPPAERRADVLILGANPTLPFDDAEDIAAFGARELRLLPSAERRRASLEEERMQDAADPEEPAAEQED